MTSRTETCVVQPTCSSTAGPAATGSRSVQRFTLSLAVLLVASQAARAQYPDPVSAASSANIEGIAVTGKAELKARPNFLEIDLQVAASAEVTADAIVKYRDAKRRIQEAFEALKLENVTVREKGLLVDTKSNPNPYYQVQTNTSKSEIQLSRTLVVSVANIREVPEDELVELIGKLLDVAKDSGAEIGPVFDPYEYYYYGYRRRSGGLSRFVLDDYGEIQEKAYEQAVQEARKRAVRLANLSGVDLGPVLAIREVTTPGRRVASPTGLPAPDDSSDRLESSKFEEIPVRVELIVRFGIAPKRAASE